MREELRTSQGPCGQAKRWPPQQPRIEKQTQWGREVGATAIGEGRLLQEPVRVRRIGQCARLMKFLSRRSEDLFAAAFDRLRDCSMKQNRWDICALFSRPLYCREDGTVEADGLRSLPCDTNQLGRIDPKGISHQGKGRVSHSYMGDSQEPLNGRVSKRQDPEVTLTLLVPSFVNSKHSEPVCCPMQTSGGNPFHIDPLLDLG